MIINSSLFVYTLSVRLSTRLGNLLENIAVKLLRREQLLEGHMHAVAPVVA